MEVHIGSDHRGYELKLEVIEYLISLGHTCTDHGCHGTEGVDYPDFAKTVGAAVAGSPEEALGVLICGSGVGIAIPANKVAGVRCVVAWCEHVAEYGRRHNHANVLAFSADLQTLTSVKRCLDAYMASAPEGGRHAGRVEMINAMDSQH